MTRSGLSMCLLQKHHVASKAGQALKLNSQGLREWCYCFFLQLQTLHFDTGLLFPQAERHELRQNWEKTNSLIASLQSVGNGPLNQADMPLKAWCAHSACSPSLQEGTAGTARCPAALHPCCPTATQPCSSAATLPHSPAATALLHARAPDTAPASLLFLVREHNIVSIRKTGTRSGNQHRGLGAHHHKREGFQFHISPPSKACLESPLHTGSLMRQLPCTSCRTYTL